MNMKNIENFKKWLSERGCEILPPTNQYELVRFKGKQIGVIYNTLKCSNSFASDAYDCFVKNKKWDGKPISTGRYNSYIKQKKELLQRDGNTCFYCGKELGEDITVEHLISLNRGGKNDLSNMVLAHEKCNQQVSNIPIFQKVNIAIQNRKK